MKLRKSRLSPRVWRGFATLLTAPLLAAYEMIAEKTAQGAPTSNPGVAAAPCVAGPTTLCLNGQRFKVEARWKDFQNNTGAGQAVSLTGDTGYFWFFSPSNVELVVKAVDGRAFNQSFWVFYGALSNVEYTLTVTDTVTGNVKTYVNPSGTFGSVGDTSAFPSSGAARPTQASATQIEEVERAEASIAMALRESLLNVPNAAAGATAPFSGSRKPSAEAATGACVATATSLCLNGNRFRVEVAWTDFAGNTGVGNGVSLTGDTGYFWFFSSNNVELAVKVLDARVLNERFWVFYGALSNVQYEMTVTDTLTGSIRTYSNPSGRFASTGDTEGFRAGLSVTTHLDSSRGVSKTIETTGGSLSATAADGTVFTLTVPADALRSPETIRMTPVTAIDRLPLSGGLSAAVDLEPVGLRLFEPATLTITPATAIPLADEVTFAWRGSGEEFFLFPPELATPTIAMKVMHFSGYGVGRGTAADQAAQQAHPPGSSEDALDQRVQDIYSKRRKGLLSARPAGAAALVAPADDAAFFERLGEELQHHYDSVIGPGLHVKRSCANGAAFFSSANSWARHAELTGFGTRFAAEILAIQLAMIDAMVDCYNESFDKCVMNNEPTRAAKMLSVLHGLAVLGADSRVDSNKVARCARFELDFESVIEELAPQGSAFKWRHQVHAVVPITFSLAGMKGNADLTYTSLTYTGPPVDPCSQTSVGSPSVFQVTNLGFDLNEFEGDAPPPYTLTMDYDPGYPNFVFTLTCPLSPPVVFQQERWRSEYYDHHHAGEIFGSGFRIVDFEKVGGRIFARRTYQPSSAFAAETTILNLKHTPQ